MKRVHKIIVPILLFSFFAFCVPMIANSQAADPGCDPLEPGCPVDGGVLFLVAAGIGIGAKKVIKRK